MTSEPTRISPNVEAGLSSRRTYDTELGVVYGVVFLICLSVWFLAVQAPLREDETVSYWQIAGGFKQIWARTLQTNSFAAYFYILWLTKTVLGEKELLLRVPSILAMLAAVYVFYRCARELFAWDISLIATIMFVLPRWIVFAAIDVRPYAFALLATNLTILTFLRWTSTQRGKWAVLFGVASASILYFQYLFSIILAAFIMYYLLSQRFWSRKNLQQIAVAVACFTILILPVLPGLKYVYETRTSHSFAGPPQSPIALFAQHRRIGVVLLLGLALALAAGASRLLALQRQTLSKLLLCAALALVPISCLYLISIISPLHLFIGRYLLVAVPGLALCSGWLFGLINLRVIRASLCFALAAFCVFQSYMSPASRRHGGSWKGSLAFVAADTVKDHAPLAMCSPLIESAFQTMPAIAQDSMLFAPLSYYRVDTTVIPFPIVSNGEAERQARQLVSQSAHARTRFLMLVFPQSAGVLDLLAEYSHSTHRYRVLGTFDGVSVIQFDPLPSAR